MVEKKAAKKPVKKEVTKAKPAVKTAKPKAPAKAAPKPAPAAKAKAATKTVKPEETAAVKVETKATATKSAAKKTVKRPLEERAHSKRYNEARRQVDPETEYPLSEAVHLAKETSTTKFDATVELHLRLGIDARQAEQSVRGQVNLPAGTGKERKVLAFVPAAKQAAAKKAGADFVSDEPTVKKIKDGWTGFDVAVATPDQMAAVGKLGTVLGPKGLMPNPKSGTVSEDPEKAIQSVKAGSIEFRVAKDATAHAGIGKASFDEADLAKNIAAYYQAVRAAKPDGTKGTFIRSVTLSSSMGPGVKVKLDSLDELARAGKAS